MKAAETRPLANVADSVSGPVAVSAAEPFAGPVSKSATGAASVSNGQKVAAKLMETVPLIMYYIRSNVMRQGETPASLPQLRVMSFINNCPGSGLSRLAESLGVANATASTMIERLVKAGMVIRSSDPINRRNVILSLTPEGEEHLMASRSIAIEEISRVLSLLPPEKIAVVEESLAMLKDVFTEANSKI